MLADEEASEDLEVLADEEASEDLVAEVLSDAFGSVVFLEVVPVGASVFSEEDSVGSSVFSEEDSVGSSVFSDSFSADSGALALPPSTYFSISAFEISVSTTAPASSFEPGAGT